MAVLKQLIVGGGVTAATLVFHTLVIGVIALVVRAGEARFGDRHRFRRIVAATLFAGTLLVLAHVVEVLAWALVYRLCGIVADAETAVYFAFVNYTTLGYGDIVPPAHWRLIGPITAADGVLMFGLSTAVLFYVIGLADAGRRPTRPPP